MTSRLIVFALILILVGSSQMLRPAPAHASQNLLLTITPSASILEMGDYVWLNVSVENAVDLYAWQFKLCWEAYTFFVAEVAYPPNHIFSGRDDATLFDPMVRNDSGNVMAGASLLGEAPTFSGSGHLADVKLVANIPGNWVFTLDSADTIFLDSNLDILSCSSEDFSVLIEPYPVPKATLSIDPPSTVVGDLVWINENYTFSVNVVVTNVYGLHSWQIRILYDNSVLNCLEPNAEELVGRFSWWSSLPRDEWINGRAILKTIHFQTIGSGNASLQFDESYTRLFLPSFSGIEYMAENGIADVGTYFLFDLAHYHQTYPLPPLGFFMDPQYSFAEVGQTFTVAICSSVGGYAGQARINFNNSILQAERVWGTRQYTPVVDNPGGYILMANSPMSGSIDSPWTFGYVDFIVLRNERCRIDFDTIDSYILDEDLNCIPSNFTCGQVNTYASINERVDIVYISVTIHSGTYSNVTRYDMTLSSTSRLSDLRLSMAKRTMQFDTAVYLELNATIESANFTVPKGLFSEYLKVFVDGELTKCTKCENETYVFLNFTFSRTTHIIVIEATEASSFEVSKDGEAVEAYALTNSTISSFQFDENSSKLSFNVAGPTGTHGYCNFTLPKGSLDEHFAVLVNGTAVPYTVSESANFVSICFEYSHSSSLVQILSTVQGDITGDRKVDVRDVSMSARAFGTCPSDARWAQQADLDRNSKIDVKDIALIAKSFGKEYA